jgi:hypothetical protein
METTTTTTLDVAKDAPAGGQQAEVKMLPQSEVDRIIAERLARQKAQYADYDELKAKAAKWAEVEESQKTEAQKTQERVAQLERERDEALARSNDRLIRAAFVAEAAKVGALYPEDLFALADRAGVSVDEQGNVVGVTEAVQAVVTAGRIPLAMNRPASPKLDGGAGSGARPAESLAPLSEAELEMARRLGIPAEKYAARKAEAAKQAAERR